MVNSGQFALVSQALFSRSGRRYQEAESNPKRHRTAAACYTKAGSLSGQTTAIHNFCSEVNRNTNPVGPMGLNETAA
jgi:hypothetical protein